MGLGCSQLQGVLGAKAPRRQGKRRGSSSAAGLDCGRGSPSALQRIVYNPAIAAGVQDEKAMTDAVATGVAVVLFWPAAFLVSGRDGQNAAQLVQLPGQMAAIEQSITRKVSSNRRPMLATSQVTKAAKKLPI